MLNSRAGVPAGFVVPAPGQQLPGRRALLSQRWRYHGRLDPSVEIARSATVTQALARMTQAHAGRFLVMDGNRLAGLITRSDIARFVQTQTMLSGAAATPADR